MGIFSFRVIISLVRNIAQKTNMSIIKVIELLANSNQSWEDAAQQAVNEASKSIRNIKSVYIHDLSAMVDGSNRITEYRGNVKLTFEIE